MFFLDHSSSKGANLKTLLKSGVAVAAVLGPLSQAEADELNTIDPTPSSGDITRTGETDTNSSPWVNASPNTLTIKTDSGLAQGILTNTSTLTNSSGATIKIDLGIDPDPSTLLNDTGGTLDNSGVIINEKYLSNKGTLTNYSGATITNNKYIKNLSGGVLSNSGMMESSGGAFALKNELGATLTNTSTGVIDDLGAGTGGSLLNGGMVTNDGTMSIGNGFLNYSGATFTNSSGATFTKVGVGWPATVLSNSGGIVNAGMFTNSGAYIINASGATLTNLSGGVITNTGFMKNDAGGLVTNSGGGVINNEAYLILGRVDSAPAGGPPAYTTSPVSILNYGSIDLNGLGGSGFLAVFIYDLTGWVVGDKILLIDNTGSGTTTDFFGASFFTPSFSPVFGFAAGQDGGLPGGNIYAVVTGPVFAAPAVVPEPSTYALMSTMVALCGYARSRRREES